MTEFIEEPMRYVFGNLILFVLMSGSFAFAADELPQYFTYQGKLTDGTGAAITGTHTLQFTVLAPAAIAGGNCILYQESHAAVDLHTDGIFALKVGTGTRNAGIASFSMSTLFSNNTSTQIVPDGADCSNGGGGYTPSAGDARVLRVAVDGTALSDQQITTNPFAAVAETVQGYGPSSFIKITGAGANDVSQANIVTLTNASDASTLHHHNTTNDARYVKLASAGNQNFGSGNVYTTGKIGIGTATPVANLDIQSSNPSIRVGGTGGTGNTIESTLADNVLLFKTNSTLALTLDATQGASFAGSVKTAGTFQLGNYNTAAETTLLTQLGVLGTTATGAMWVNNQTPTAGVLKYWDGDAALSIATVGNQVTSVSAGTGIEVTGTASVPIVSAKASTASRALASDASGYLTASSVTATELGYLSGVTSALQTQLDARVLKAGDTMTGELASSVGTFKSTVADGAANEAFTFNTSTAYSTAGAKLFSVANNGTEKFAIDYSGAVIFPNWVTGGRPAGASRVTGVTGFNTTTGYLETWDGSGWVDYSEGGGGGSVTWASVDKTTSSLADITTRSAADLSSGTLNDGRLSSNVPLKNASNIFSVGNQEIDIANTAHVGLTIKGVAAQAANLMELKNSAGTLLYSVEYTGTPTANTDLTNKSFVTSAISTAGGSYLPLAGGTMSGQLASSVGTFKSTVADGAAAKAYSLDTSTTYSTNGAKLLSVANNTSEVFSISASGTLATSNTVIFSPKSPATSTTLTADYNISDSSDMEVVSTTSYADAGYLSVESEVIAYTGKTANSFTGITRAALGTTEANHTSAFAIYPSVHALTTLYKKSDGNLAGFITSSGSLSMGIDAPNGGVLNAKSSAYGVIGSSSGGVVLTAVIAGVYGLNSSAGAGVNGLNSSTGYGVYGQNTSSGYGVAAVAASGTALYARSATGISGLFQTSVTDGSNTQPTLIAKLNTSQTADLLQIQNTAGTSLVKVTSGGLLGVGSGITPLAHLDIDGGLVLRDSGSTVTINADNYTLTVGDRSYIKLDSNDTTAANRDFTLTQGVRSGQILVLMWTSATNKGRLADNLALSPAGVTYLHSGNPWTAAAVGQTITLLFDGTNWVEIARADN